MANETLHIGSEADDGSHLRGTAGWPYSIYCRDDRTGGCDRVICHGIQSMNDAELMLVLLNGATDLLSPMYRPFKAA